MPNASIGTHIRSWIYVIAIYGLMSVMGIVCLPLALVGGRNAVIRIMQAWARSSLFLLRPICGIRYEIRGDLKALQRPVLIASKHQSMWETVFFVAHCPGAAIVLKRELTNLPIYGWYAKRAQMISVDREGGASALKDMVQQASARLGEGRPVAIFPEGTRQPPGAAPEYKPGIALLYQQLGVPCVPVALNSGLCWPASGVLRIPGTITIEILEPIDPGLPRAAFMQTLQERIETAANRLLPSQPVDAAD